jgi:hypothetical protein
MANEPQSLVLELLRGVRADVAEVKRDVAGVKADVAGVKADVAGMKTEMAGVKADLLATRKELGDQIVGLRRAVVEYHSAVIGHGVIISELEARVRRMEQHLDLPPLGAH